MYLFRSQFPSISESDSIRGSDSAQVRPGSNSRYSILKLVTLSAISFAMVFSSLMIWPRHNAAAAAAATSAETPASPAANIAAASPAARQLSWLLHSTDEQVCTQGGCASADSDATLTVEWTTLSGSTSAGSFGESISPWGNSRRAKAHDFDPVVPTGSFCVGGIGAGCPKGCELSDFAGDDVKVHCFPKLFKNGPDSKDSAGSSVLSNPELLKERTVAEVSWPDITAQPAHYYRAHSVTGNTEPAGTQITQNTEIQRATETVHNTAVDSELAKWLFAGFEYSLTLNGYDWEPLTTTLPMGSAGSATVMATPVEVRWELGPLNATVEHNRPTSLICNGPGDPDFGASDREFLDWRTYEGYKNSADCKFVWWALSHKTGETFDISAHVEWDVTLHVTGYDSPIEVGKHTKTYTTTNWWVTLPSGAGIGSTPTN